MKYKILIAIALIILVTLMIQSVTAQQIYKEDTEVDLKVPCFNNNSYCSSSSNCNITIVDFEDVVVVNNDNMTTNTAWHNYTLNVTRTATAGEYRATVVCADGGRKGKSTFYYILTPTGNAFDISSAIVYGLILVIMFGVTLFFLAFGSLTESPGVKLFFNMISYLTMTLTVGSGYILLQNSGVQSNISSTMNGMMYIVGIVLVIIMYYIFINQTRHALALLKVKKGFGSEFDNPPVF